MEIKIKNICQQPIEVVNNCNHRCGLCMNCISIIDSNITGFMVEVVVENTTNETNIYTFLRETSHLWSAVIGEKYLTAVEEEEIIMLLAKEHTVLKLDTLA